MDARRRRARHARVHLDDDHVAVVGVDGELDVRSARLDADRADDRDAASRIRWYSLSVSVWIGATVMRVAGVHAHRVDVLDRADDDDVVVLVAHHLHLVLLPPDDRLLDEHLGHRRGVEAALDDLLELLDVVGDAAARAAERERGADDQRQADVVEDLARVVHRVHDAAARDLQADLDHQVLEDLPVLAAEDGVAVGADHLHAVLLEDALVEAGHAGVQAGLPAERREQRVDGIAACGFAARGSSRPPRA